jgi:hypothetical protein
MIERIPWHVFDMNRLFTHRNLFQQGYAMQFHRVMEPVLARLGVQLYSHNFAKGGIGTTQESLGMSTLCGARRLTFACGIRE